MYNQEDTANMADLVFQKEPIINLQSHHLVFM